MKISLKSDEVNFLIYRYLIDNGFSHTAYCFKNEGNLGYSSSPFINQLVTDENWAVGRISSNFYLPPHCLLTLLQKAMMYLWVEHHADDETGGLIECDSGFRLFSRHTCEKSGTEHDHTSGDEEDHRNEDDESEKDVAKDDRKGKDGKWTKSTTSKEVKGTRTASSGRGKPGARGKQAALAGQLQTLNARRMGGRHSRRGRKAAGCENDEDMDESDDGRGVSESTNNRGRPSDSEVGPGSNSDEVSVESGNERSAEKTPGDKKPLGRRSASKEVISKYVVHDTKFSYPPSASSDITMKIGKDKTKYGSMARSPSTMAETEGVEI